MPLGISSNGLRAWSNYHLGITLGKCIGKLCLLDQSRHSSALIGGSNIKELTNKKMLLAQETFIKQSNRARTNKLDEHGNWRQEFMETPTSAESTIEDTERRCDLDTGIRGMASGCREGETRREYWDGDVEDLKMIDSPVENFGGTSRQM